MRSRPRLVEESVVRVHGPWTHRDVHANGIRFHVAEAGRGPLVLLLHGFPQFWWTWRHQLVALADAGFRAVAPDLRGYGATDKPPRGYDPMTAAADVAGLIRALGEREAVVVGHDWGGNVAWTVAATHPRLVRRLAIVSVPHPLCWAAALARQPAQRGLIRSLARFQLPWHPERWLVADGAANVARLIEDCAGPSFPLVDTQARWREAMLILGAPHCSLEYFRWAVRSIPRSDGRRFRRLLRQPITAPTLQLHGSQDRWVLPDSARGSGRFVAGDYVWRSISGVGHFPHEEAPEVVSDELVRWSTQ
ncbi:MAG TPA: alpha/beta hydrolase [Mycobacteriales bacterium]|nr:alpha/beta hydrolase [Mycobacteriales bacterium]